MSLPPVRRMFVLFSLLRNRDQLWSRSAAFMAVQACWQRFSSHSCTQERNRELHDQRDRLSFSAVTALPGRCLFVHVGVHPRLTLDRKTLDDVLWIRWPFLHANGHPLLHDGAWRNPTVAPAAAGSPPLAHDMAGEPQGRAVMTDGWLP